MFLMLPAQRDQRRVLTRRPGAARTERSGLSMEELAFFLPSATCPEVWITAAGKVPNPEAELLEDGCCQVLCSEKTGTWE